MVRNKPQASGFADRLAAILDPKFLIDVGRVAFDGQGGNEKLRCNLFVAKALGQQFQDVKLTVSQGLNQRLRAD